MGVLKLQIPQKIFLILGYYSFISYYAKQELQVHVLLMGWPFPYSTVFY